MLPEIISIAKLLALLLKNGEAFTTKGSNVGRFSKIQLFLTCMLFLFYHFNIIVPECDDFA